MSPEPFHLGARPWSDLRGHVAVVTGGGSGIGLGVARGLAAAGADVAVLGRSEERLAEACSGLEALGSGRALAVPCDVGEEAEVVEALARVRHERGPIGSLCTAAGVPSDGADFLDLSLDAFRAVVRVNLEGTFLCFREAARHMVRDGVGGSLVAVASLSAVHGQVRGQAYSASKGGVTAFVRACAVELARHGIRANTILPGSIDTPMAGPFQHTPTWDAKVRPRIPARRAGVADEIAGAAVYLASAASSYHSGDTLTIDGGYAVF